MLAALSAKGNRDNDTGNESRAQADLAAFETVANMRRGETHNTLKFSTADAEHDARPVSDTPFKGSELKSLKMKYQL